MNMPRPNKEDFKYKINLTVIWHSKCRNETNSKIIFDISINIFILIYIFQLKIYIHNSNFYTQMVKIYCEKKYNF